MGLQSFRCTHCNGEVQLDDNLEKAYCMYCGSVIQMKDKSEKTINKNININKKIHYRYTNDADIIRAGNEATKEKYDFLSGFIGIGVLLLIGFLLWSIPSIITTVNEKKGNIRAGFSGDLIGEDYQSVVAHFESAGFTNIELIDLDDSSVAFWNEGKVKMISVGGDTSFDSTDWFAPDTKVVISYH